MKKLLITDLDGTLYDWLNFFVPSFYAMADSVAKKTLTPIEEVLREYRELHVKYKNVEHPYTTLELPCVRERFGNLSRDELKERLNDAFHAFNSMRKKKLRLFDGAAETLERLKDASVTIVGFTESGEENGYYRLRKLGIDQCFAKVYVWDSYYTAHPKSQKTVRLNVKKPCPEVLHRICESEGVGVKDAIYCGDSMTKDIYMAHYADMECIRVCCAKENEDSYEKLKAISHWTRRDYEEEAERRICIEKEHIEPDYVVYDFGQIEKIIIK
ncbi:MAG: HAD family hydrolase [Clostridia bacterium]|nr:HAD family hydrolase [Clostridia bacterium]